MLWTTHRNEILENSISYLTQSSICVIGLDETASQICFVVNEFEQRFAGNNYENIVTVDLHIKYLSLSIEFMNYFYTSPRHVIITLRLKEYLSASGSLNKLI